MSRDIICDLWALCAAGEASDDSRRLVDAFLDQDPELAARLRANPSALDVTGPALPVDHEAKTLLRMKRRLGRRSPLRLVALAFTGLAILRFMEQTRFITSPVEVVALSIAAVVTWVASAWHSRYLQQKAVFRDHRESAR